MTILPYQEDDILLRISHASIRCITWLGLCCMPNMHDLISAHNKSVLAKHTQPETNGPKECDCRQKDSCPLFGKCLTESIVYQAIVKREDTGEEKGYVGHTEGKFKVRNARATQT